MGKRQGYNPMHTDIPGHVHTRASVPRWRGIYRKESKLRKGEFEPESFIIN